MSAVRCPSCHNPVVRVRAAEGTLVLLGRYVLLKGGDTIVACRRCKLEVNVTQKRATMVPVTGGKRADQ